MRKLDQVGASAYLSEVRELSHSILIPIEALERARVEWRTHRRTASDAAATPPEEFPLETFNSALSASREQQGIIFETVEALLAAWARLSLLFHPLTSRCEEGKWRAARGKALRDLLALPNDTVLSQRDFRDAWMHFDERLDAAFKEGWLGNRQLFTDTAGVGEAIKHTVRVIDVEVLAFHFRTRSGDCRAITVADL